MSKAEKTDKKGAKEQARRIQELNRQQEQARMRQQMQKIRQQEEKLRKTSSPLVQYGLLDAYEFFLKNLAQNGIPQPNVFEFAAQAVLKYQKKIRRKGEQLKKIEQYNKSVIQGQKKGETSPLKRKVIKSNMLPFKGEINQDQLNILNKINLKSKTKGNQHEQQEYQYRDD